MEVTAATDAANPSTKQLIRGQDEFSLAMFPMGVLSHALPTDKERKQKQYKRTFEGQVWSEQSGGMVDAVVTLTTNPDVGLPNGNDEPLGLTLINLALAHGPADPRTRYEFVPAHLIRLLKRNQSGRTWSKHLPEAFARLTHVRYTYDFAWFDYNDQEHVTRLTFGFLESSSYTQQTSNPRNATVWFTLNAELCRRINDGRLKTLDLPTYLSLENPIAMRLYRIFDRMRYIQPTFSTDLAKFAFGNLGLSRRQFTYTDNHGNEKIHYSKLKHKLTPHLKKLETEGTLTPATAKRPRFRKIKFGDGSFAWRLQGELKRKRNRTARATTPEPNNTEDPLTQSLIERGVKFQRAKELTASPDYKQRIPLAIEVYDWHNTKGENKGPGYLVAAIQDHYYEVATPEGFTSASERDAARRKKAERERQRRAEAQAEREQQEREREEQRQLDQVWHNETDQSERDAILKAVLAGNEFVAKRYRRDPQSSVVHSMCLDELKRRRTRPPK